MSLPQNLPLSKIFRPPKACRPPEFIAPQNLGPPKLVAPKIWRLLNMSLPTFHAPAHTTSPKMSHIQRQETRKWPWSKWHSPKILPRRQSRAHFDWSNGGCRVLGAIETVYTAKHRCTQSKTGEYGCYRDTIAHGKRHGCTRMHRGHGGCTIDAS